MLNDIIKALFSAGLSARKTGDVIKNLIGSSISASYVSSKVKIAEEVIDKFINRKLVEEYPVIYIYASYYFLPAGLEGVIKEILPEVEHRLCWFHLKKNIKKVRKS